MALKQNGTVCRGESRMEKVRLGSGRMKSFRFEGDRSFCDPRGPEHFLSPQDRTGCPLSRLPLRAACPRDQRGQRRIVGNRVADPLLAFSRGCQTINSPFPSFARSLCLWPLAPLTSSNAVILASTFKGRKKIADGVVSFRDHSKTWHPVSAILVGDTWRVFVNFGRFFWLFYCLLNCWFKILYGGGNLGWKLIHRL